VKFAVGCCQRLAHVHGVVDIVPPQTEHFFASQSEPEPQVDSRVPGVLAACRRGDAPTEFGVDHGEGSAFPGR
jgi:hypothetical protein